MLPHPSRSARRGVLLAASLLACAPSPAARSAAEHGRADHAPAAGAHSASAHWAAPDSAAPDSATPGLTPTVRTQLAAARRAVAALGTPQAAVAAGYRPMFGHVPLQGEHYVRVDLVASDSFDLERPPVLVFAPVKGTLTLVGAAYAYLRSASAPPPAGFDGDADAWHSHERLARVPGQHIVMTHAWFVDAPEGPFARYNPWLPFYAAGLTPPARPTLAEPAAGEASRRLGLALALATAPPMLFELIESRGGASLRSRTDAARIAIRALIPRLAAAERAGDRAAYERLAREAAGRADSLVEVYRRAAADRPVVRRLVDRTVDEFMGRGHGVEEELEALMRGGASEPARREPHQHAPGH